MKIIKHKRLLRLFSVIFLLTSYQVYSEVFFTGSAMTTFSLIPAKKIEETDIRFYSRYTGQLQLNDRLLFRGAFSLRTGNLVNTAFMQPLPSMLHLNELSFAYRFRIERATTRLALFAAEYESIGTDVFLQRYLGTQPINSALLRNEAGLLDTALFSINGFGGSLNVRFAAPVSTAVYMYYNEQDGIKYFNTDFRIAGANKTFIGDFSFGVHIPLYISDTDGKEIPFAFKQAKLYAAFTMLAGNTSYANLFLQTGVQLQADKFSAYSLKTLSDVYLFFEPRFAIKNFRFSFALFSMPETFFKNLPYIEDPLGAAISFESVPLYTSKTVSVLGLHAISGTAHPLITNFDIKALSLQIVPYLSISGKGGTFNAALQLRPLKYADISLLLNFTMGYKINF